jgi:cobalamin biosynthesis protein CobD/CbiB
MSEKNQIVVVLIVALLLGAFIDRPTALKIVVGVALLWSLQNQSAIVECIRKLSSHLRGGLLVREYRGDLRNKRRAA